MYYYSVQFLASHRGTGQSKEGKSAPLVVFGKLQPPQRREVISQGRPIPARRQLLLDPELRNRNGRNEHGRFRSSRQNSSHPSLSSCRISVDASQMAQADPLAILGANE